MENGNSKKKLQKSESFHMHTSKVPPELAQSPKKQTSSDGGGGGIVTKILHQRNLKSVAV